MSKFMAFTNSPRFPDDLKLPFWVQGQTLDLEEDKSLPLRDHLSRA